MVGFFRTIAILIDTVAFSLIDNAYNLIDTFSSGTLLKQEFVENLMDNFYVVIGIFALFRVALLLVNSVINPEKLTEKGNGIGNVLTNFLVMFVLLVMTPLIFKEAINLQSTIVKGNYIQKLFINTEALEGTDPGDVMRNMAIGSLVTIDADALEKYNDDKCSDKCEEAIEAYQDMEENGFSFGTLSKYIGVTVKNDDGDKVYVYNYMFIVTFAVGCFIAYVLFSFALDIAIRMIELTVLQIIAPLFIATYIDPKSAKSGAFHNWLTTVGKTYASLFIKLAVLALMLLLISVVGNLDKYANDLDLSGFEKLVLLIGILIFAKKAPKWITEMIGVKSEGLGGLSLAKKLGGAALIGGAAAKGLESAKKYGGQKAKNFAGNRLRNTAARIGGMKEADKEYRNKKKNGSLSNAETGIKGYAKTLWQQGRGAAKQSRANNWGANTQGVLKDVATGYMAGRLNLNPNAKSLGEQIKTNIQGTAMGYNTRIGNTQEELAKKADAAKKMKKASQMRMGKVDVKANGERNSELSWQGYNEFKSAIGSRVLTEDAAYIKDAANRGFTFDANTGRFSNGMSLSDYKNTFTQAGQADIAAFVMKNFQAQSETLQSNIQLRVSNDEKISGYHTQLSQLCQTPDDREVSKAILKTHEEMIVAQASGEVALAETKKQELNAYRQGAAPEIVQMCDQIIQLSQQNTMLNSQSSGIVGNLQESEETFEKAPHKCPTAVQQADGSYHTAVGIFALNDDGTYSYSRKVDHEDAMAIAGFRIDPRIISEVANKVANVASSKDADAKAAYSALEPKK